MKLGFVLGLMLSVFGSLAFAAPIIVLNGGGSGEFSVIFVRANFSDMLTDSVAGDVSLTAAEQQIVSEIAAKSLPIAVFKNTESLGSSLYQLHGDEVWINQDLLWTDSSRTVAFQAADGLDLWIQIAASRYGISGPDLATLESKAAKSIRDGVIRGGIQNSDTENLEFVLWKRSSGRDELVVRDHTLVPIDLTGAIQKEVGCESFKIFAPTWLPTGSSDQGVVTLLLSFGVKWHCENNRGTSFGKAVFQSRPDAQGILELAPSAPYVSVER